MGIPLQESAGGQRTRQRELGTALDSKLAKLKNLLSSCVGLFMELEGGALWEGLVMYACRRWEAVKDICQLFYEVRRCELDHVILCHVMLRTLGKIDCCEL